ncbi:MAG: hypothetical protein E7Z96_02865 [Actinomycetaceae bacterium]|nr:hypothetical protein [Actinomycetaceae bacterium]
MKINRRDQFLADLYTLVSEQSSAAQDVLAALGDAPVQAYFLRPETVFDQDSVFDSVSIFCVTDARLLILVSGVTYELSPAGELVTTVQSVGLGQIRDFQVTRRRVLDGPQSGALSMVSMRLRWGGGWAFDTFPASCDDPTCDADHGTVSVGGGDDAEILLDSSLADDIFARGLQFINELSGILAQR